MRRRLCPGLRLAFVAAVVALVSTVWPSATPARADGFDVTRFDDVSLGDCTPDDCSLREAIMQANRTPGLDVIRLPAGTYTVGFAGRYEDFAQTGDLDIVDTVSIYGAGADRTVITANGLDRVFDIRPGISGTVIIAGLTIAGGDVLTDRGPFDPPNSGGGLRIASSTELVDVEIRGNAGFTGGGIVQQGGTVLLSGSTVADNRAFRQGGGISAEHGTTLTIERTTVSGNSTSEVDPSNVGAGSGGGLWTGVPTTLRNVTFGQNMAAGRGDTISSFDPSGTTFWNTIVDRRPVDGANACFGGGLSRGNNVFRDVSCVLAGRPNDRVSVDPRLAPLRLYGGTTRTQLLLPGSPAIDAGDNTTCVIPNDQRRVPIPVDGNGDGSAICDSGAVEVVPTADLADVYVSVTDGLSTVRPNEGVFYMIVVGNRGPAAATAVVSDLFPLDLLANVRWTCRATAGSTCGRASGVSDIASVPVTLAGGGEATFEARGTVRSSARGTLDNTVRAIVNSDLPFDVQTANNVATDSDFIVATFPISAACPTRPNVRLVTAPAGPGRLQVTVRATTSAAVPSNSLREIQFRAPTNALIDVPGFATGARFPFVAGPLATPELTFYVRREVAGQATSVPLVVVDDCGEWVTFVGGGPGAF